MPVYTINYGLEETDNENQQFRWGSTTLPPGQQTYAKMVSCLINSEYNSDEMQAIINNYVLDPEDEEIKSEWEQMQAFRAKAKSIAHDIQDGVITEETVLSLD